MWYSRKNSLSRTRAWSIGKKRKSLNICLKNLLKTYNKRSHQGHQGIYLELVYKLRLKLTSHGILVQIPKINLLDLADLSLLLILPYLRIFTNFTRSIGSTKSTKFIEFIDSTKSISFTNSTESASFAYSKM